MKIAFIGHGLNSVQSGSEAVQALVPDAWVVKAFTIYGFENSRTRPTRATASSR